MSKGYTLITGSSGGIGEALARRFARDKTNLILAARNSEALESIRKDLVAEYDIEVRVHALDLAKPQAAEELYAWTKKHKLRVDCIVNNAGSGDRAEVVKADLGRLQAMVRLNAESLTALSHLFGKDMAARRNGKIVNIASIAGFVPGPGMAVYYATKAFVISFSQALYAELKHQGVQVICICPAATGTGFASAAGASKTALFSGKLASSEEVAAFAYKSIKKNRPLAIWGWQNRVVSKLVSLAPRRAVLSYVRRLQ